MNMPRAMASSVRGAAMPIDNQASSQSLNSVSTGSSVDQDTLGHGTLENFVPTGQRNSSSRARTTTANIYTPLLTTPRSTNGQTSTDSSSLKVTTSAILSEPAKPLPVVLKKPDNKSLSEHRSAASRGQRSSVRPFFCCGSELSLVSLVDGLELKEGSSAKDKKVCSIESNTSSEEDESLSSTNSPSRKSSGASGQVASPNGENRQTVVRRKKKDKHNVKKKFWSIHFRGRWNPRWRMSQPQRSVSHRCDLSLHNRPGCSGTYQARGSPSSGRRSPRARPLSGAGQLIDLTHVHDFDRLYPVDDIDTIRIRERAQEMATGVDVFPVSLTQAYGPRVGFSGSVRNILRHQSRLGSVNSETSLASLESPTEDYSLLMNDAVWQWQGSRSMATMDGGSAGSPRIHTQVDFIHCLVPDLVKILGCPFYWGVMDRYEAERLLDSKPEGTFLLRDSAQEDFLFSVSFRRYNRSLHARVEQWNHRFSFDAHDPAVFSAPSVCELMEHYKDPCCCMFFEPMLTRPLPRNFPFSLQHICRAVICDHLAYDQILALPLPNSLKQFLQIYHYKQKVRVRHFDGPDLAFGRRNDNSSNSSSDNVPNFQMLLK